MNAKKQDVEPNKENSGTSEFQVTVFTNRIKNLTEHLKLNKRSQHKKRIDEARGKKKETFELRKKKSNERYESIVKSLGLRR